MKTTLSITLYCIILSVVVSETPRNCIMKGSISAKVTSPVEWIKAGVEIHNDLRAKHGLSPLKLNMDLCKSAQWTANENAKAHRMKHTLDMSGIGIKGMDCGENLATYGTTGTVELKPAAHSTQRWYDEIKDFNWDTGKSKNGKPVGHFTQVVWKDSKEMCMAYAKGTKDSKGYTSYYVAAHYYPPGNYIGAEKRNVPPLNVGEAVARCSILITFLAQLLIQKFIN